MLPPPNWSANSKTGVRPSQGIWRRLTATHEGVCHETFAARLSRSVVCFRAGSGVRAPARIPSDRHDRVHRALRRVLRGFRLDGVAEQGQGKKERLTSGTSHCPPSRRPTFIPLSTAAAQHDTEVYACAHRRENEPRVVTGDDANVEEKIKCARS